MTVLTLVASGLVASPPATAATAPGTVGAAAADPPGSAAPSPRISVDPAQRDRVLPKDWRTSTDLLWTTAGDATGFHLLVAESRTGYTWRTAATLREPGFETDRWIGNVCLTGSGQRAVVVYAPRQFTNREQLFARGAFAAVVDLATGKVRALPGTVSLAYYNPGCGADETAVLTQSGAADLGKTRLLTFDTASGKLLRTHEVKGQVTSAVPVSGRIIAGYGAQLAEITSGGVRQLAKTASTPSQLRADNRGGVAYLTLSGDTAVAGYLTGASTREFARGPATAMGLAAGAGGTVFLTGQPSSVGTLPATVTRVPAAVTAELSSLGRLSLIHQPKTPATAGRAESPNASLPASSDPDVASPVAVQATVLASGAKLDFAFLPGAAAAATRQATTSDQISTLADSATDPVDASATCAVARNDVRTQVYQPHWNQVEWAADLAVQGGLTLYRPSNWKQSGLSSWSPQGMFPSVALRGGGRVPAQILLGILAQESNLWQASSHAVEGVTGNPLIGNFYGLDYSVDGPDFWTINWSDADCGYGVSQVTDGMRKSQTTLTSTQKRAVAVDYATNIAAGLQILQRKWNQLYDAGIKVNGGNPGFIESWFGAVWAYNSGVNPQAITGNTTGCTPSPSCTDDRGNWGLGWSNNPANPDYDPTRQPFLENSYDDARHPQDWPYPEKVIGWAAYPIAKDDGNSSGYLQAWWISVDDRTRAKPPLDTFCDSSNNCNLSWSGVCGYWDYHCWWHNPVQWRDCSAGICGFENLRYSLGSAEPPDANKYPCPTSMPSTSWLVIDDVADSVPAVRPNCPRRTNNGTFALNFASDGTNYRSKVDFHQIGAGFEGHFWFGHSYQPGYANGWMKVTGTWTLDRSLSGWARVLVHMPDHGAHTQRAAYTVNLGNGTSKTRYLAQRTEQNRWVSLGVLQFSGVPSVSLSNTAANGDGVEDVAWDAVAFQPLPAKPRNFVVALGDSYSSGEGAANDASLDYYTESNSMGGTPYANACHRSRNTWSRLAFLQDDVYNSIGARADSWDPNMDYQLLACSGAQTEHVLPIGYTNDWNEAGGQGQNREMGQAERGFLDSNTTLVTLSIGGNDSLFSKVVERCILEPWDNCQNTQMDGRYLYEYIPDLITGKTRTSVMTTIRAIRDKAPKAQIILMGYPLLIENNGDCLEPLGYGISDAEAQWLNEMGEKMRTTEAELVATLATQEGIRVTFSDPKWDFAGKAVCGDPETVHGVVIGQTAGEKPETHHVSQQSFHPKVTGASNYASSLNRTLRNLGL